jgi:hypothetical protein
MDDAPRLVVVKLGVGAIFRQKNQGLDEYIVKPLRVLSQFAGENLGILVRQRDWAGVGAAVLEEPLHRVTCKRSSYVAWKKSQPCGIGTPRPWNTPGAVYWHPWLDCGEWATAPGIRTPRLNCDSPAKSPIN